MTCAYYVEGFLHLLPLSVFMIFILHCCSKFSKHRIGDWIIFYIVLCTDFHHLLVWSPPLLPPPFLTFPSPPPSPSFTHPVPVQYGQKWRRFKEIQGYCNSGSQGGLNFFLRNTWWKKEKTQLEQSLSGESRVHTDLIAYWITLQEEPESWTI